MIESNKEINNDKVKVYFQLDNGLNQQTESLWANVYDESKNLFEIDNVPFYVYGISNKDVVACEKKDDLLFFKNIHNKSGHSTYRVFLSDVTCEQEIDKILLTGATYESSGRLFAIDVPKEINKQDIVNFLENGEKRKIWQYEIANE